MQEIIRETLMLQIPQFDFNTCFNFESDSERNNIDEKVILDSIDHIQLYLEDAQPTDQVLCMIGLKGFKEINDSKKLIET